MKKVLKKQFIIVAILSLAFINIINVSASSSAKINVSGSNTISTDATQTNKIIIGSISGSTVNAVSGTVKIEDTSCVSLNNISGQNGTSVAGNDFILASFSGISANTDMLLLSLKAGNSACKTNIIISDIAIGFMNGDTLEPNDVKYEITVASSSPSKNNDATLKDLKPNKGTLSPAFSSDNFNYNITVPEDTKILDFTATSNSSSSTISGTSCTLDSDNTTCKITVKAEDGTTKTYNVNVTKEQTKEPEKVYDTTLKSLTIDGFSFTPKFDKNTSTYKLQVPNTVTSLNVNAIPNDTNANVTITGNKNFKDGNNTISIKVTAPDGSNRIYTINVVRRSIDDKENEIEESKSSDNYLKELSTTNGVLSPEFNKDVNSYNVTVGNEVTSLDLTAIANDSKSKIEITGNENFKVGMNTVTIKITAEDGTERTYTINVKRSEEESKTKLKDLVVADYPLSPKFDPDNSKYKVTVDKDIDKLDITAIAENENSTVEIIGNSDLKEGTKTIYVKVTDENGLSHLYEIEVNKQVTKKFLGLTLAQWLIILGMLLLLGLIFIIIFLLGRKKEEKKEESKTIIEFKPEFNFGSKNGTDDDYVESGGVLNQYEGKEIPKKEEPQLIEANVKDIEPEEEFDYYDDKVTKEELIAAIKEAKRTNDSSKLQMLYKQEMLNREKKKLKEKDNNK